jgi:hypothetical protein
MDLITRTVYALIRFPDTMASGESHALIGRRQLDNAVCDMQVPRRFTRGEEPLEE